MPFLLPNQQCQITEGICTEGILEYKHTMHYPHICVLALQTGVWLRATETEISGCPLGPRASGRTLPWRFYAVHCDAAEN